MAPRRTLFGDIPIEWPTTQAQQSQTLTAFHEAGHAILMLHAGFSFSHVWIASPRSPRRYVSGIEVEAEDRGYERHGASGAVEGIGYEGVERSIMVSLAGEVAVKILVERLKKSSHRRVEIDLRQEVREGSARDWVDAMDIAEKWELDISRLAQLRKSTYKYLSRDDVWDDLIAVANALIKRRKMTMQEVQDLLKQSRRTRQRSKPKPKKKTLFE